MGVFGLSRTVSGSRPTIASRTRNFSKNQERVPNFHGAMGHTGVLKFEQMRPLGNIERGMSLRENWMTGECRQSVPLLPALGEIRPSNEIRSEPSREHGFTGVPSENSLYPPPNARHQGRTHSNVHGKLGDCSAPLTPPKHIPRVRQHLKVHEVVAPIARQHDATVLCNGSELIEQSR